MLVCCWWHFDWSFARLIAPVVTLTIVSIKIQNGDTLVLANPGPPGEWPLKQTQASNKECNYVSIVVFVVELIWVSLCGVLCGSEQFNHAQLSVFNNSWADVSDSTPAKDEPNFQVISEVSYRHYLFSMLLPLLLSLCVLQITLGYTCPKRKPLGLMERGLLQAGCTSCRQTNGCKALKHK